MNAGSAKVSYKIGWALDLVATQIFHITRKEKNILKSNEIIAGNGI